MRKAVALESSIYRDTKLTELGRVRPLVHEGYLPACQVTKACKALKTLQMHFFQPASKRHRLREAISASNYC